MTKNTSATRIVKPFSAKEESIYSDGTNANEHVDFSHTKSSQPGFNSVFEAIYKGVSHTVIYPPYDIKYQEIHCIFDDNLQREIIDFDIANFYFRPTDQVDRNKIFNFLFSISKPNILVIQKIEFESCFMVLNSKKTIKLDPSKAIERLSKSTYQNIS
jgi:hypothetical protein